MDKITAGLIALGIFAGLQITAWFLQVDGVFTASIVGIMGLIAGSIFGFTFGVKTAEIQQQEAKKEE